MAESIIFMTVTLTVIDSFDSDNARDNAQFIRDTWLIGCLYFKNTMSHCIVLHTHRISRNACWPIVTHR